MDPKQDWSIKRGRMMNSIIKWIGALCLGLGVLSVPAFAEDVSYNTPGQEKASTRSEEIVEVESGTNTYEQVGKEPQYIIRDEQTGKKNPFIQKKDLIMGSQREAMNIRPDEEIEVTSEKRIENR